MIFFRFCQKLENFGIFKKQSKVIFLIELAKATGSVISPLSVRLSVRNELISETTMIFPKLGMKLGEG